MDLGLKNKNVVVTGGSKGIGYAAAKIFLQEGAKVTICARHKEELGRAVLELGKLGKIQGCVLDGSTETGMEKLAQVASKQGNGTIDIWVNNIGTNKQRQGEYYTEAEVDYLIGANYKSALFGTQAAVKYMKEKGGSIVNIASLAARCATAIRSNIYASMKAAIIALTTTTASEYAPYGIRINAVMPGYTRTPLMDSGMFTPEVLEPILRNNILGRMAEPEEIAKPIVFLASEAASYITAAAVDVTGGHMKVINAYEAYERMNEHSLCLKAGGYGVWG